MSMETTLYIIIGLAALIILVLAFLLVRKAGQVHTVEALRRSEAEAGEKALQQQRTASEAAIKQQREANEAALKQLREANDAALK